LGLTNFPMDHFGVTDPRLKALARTPFGAAAGPAPLTSPVACDSSVRGFLGASIKNVIGPGEISAYGLPGEVGVLLVQVLPGSTAARAGLKKGDVILKCRDREVGGMDDLFEALGSAARGTKVPLDVWRLQQHCSVEVSVE
jgi:S1-C subfamily serine protease